MTRFSFNPAFEKEARLEAEQTGSYVRPIVLFQAQPKGKDSATTFEQLRNELIKIGVPKEQIAIKTSEINELKTSGCFLLPARFATSSLSTR